MEMSTVELLRYLVPLSVTNYTIPPRDITEHFVKEKQIFLHKRGEVNIKQKKKSKTLNLTHKSGC